MTDAVLTDFDLMDREYNHFVYLISPWQGQLTLCYSVHYFALMDLDLNDLIIDLFEYDVA